MMKKRIGLLLVGLAAIVLVGTGLAGSSTGEANGRMQAKHTPDSIFELLFPNGSGPSALLGTSERPELSGPVDTYDTENFRIHYTTAGEEAVPEEISGDYPAYVIEVTQAMEYVRSEEVGHFDWAAPPSDGELGGDGRYDIYLENIMAESAAGYAGGGEDGEIVGDNPISPQSETRASISFLVLDNDYREVDEYGEEEIGPLDLMWASAAHEYTHALQFGYDGRRRPNGCGRRPPRGWRTRSTTISTMATSTWSQYLPRPAHARWPTVARSGWSPTAGGTGCGCSCATSRSSTDTRRCAPFGSTPGTWTAMQR